jgi:hypothetical protein
VRVETLRKGDRPRPTFLLPRGREGGSFESSAIRLSSEAHGSSVRIRLGVPVLRRKRKPINFVLIEGGASDAEVEQVRELFTRRGFRPEVNPGLPLTGGPPTELVWGVYVALAVPISSFFAALGTQAGKDAYEAAKDWVLELLAARRSEQGPGHITLVHNNATAMRISSEIPPEALDALREIDWSTTPGGFIEWVGDRGEWVVTRADEGG